MATRYRGRNGFDDFNARGTVKMGVVLGQKAGSHDTIVVSWAFTSSAIGFGYLDGVNFNGAAGNRILVEREVTIARRLP
jgi:hypothetical protein